MPYTEKDNQPFVAEEYEAPINQHANNIYDQLDMADSVTMWKIDQNAKDPIPLNEEEQEFLWALFLDDMEEDGVVLSKRITRDQGFEIKIDRIKTPFGKTFTKQQKEYGREIKAYNKIIEERLQEKNRP